MVEDLKEFEKLIREKNILDVDTMLEESKKLIERIPNFKDRHEKTVLARGEVIEASTKLEMAFDELITKTGGRDLILNFEEKKFDLISGTKNEKELKDLSFSEKAEIVKDIMKKEVSEPPNSPPSLLDDLDRCVAIRNIFAHVPISWFAQELEFDDNPRYKHFFNKDPKWKSVSIAVKEFLNLQIGIIELIPIYIKLVLLKREMYSKILLGDSFNNILEKYKKDNPKS